MIHIIKWLNTEFNPLIVVLASNYGILPHKMSQWKYKIKIIWLLQFNDVMMILNILCVCGFVELPVGS